MLILEIYRKFKYGIRYSSESYISHLRKIGVGIGNRTTIFDPRSTIIDESRPWLIKIGDDVQITAGVTILTHGYDWSVLKGVYGEVLGSSGGGGDRKQRLHWNAQYHFKRCAHRTECYYRCQFISQ